MAETSDIPSAKSNTVASNLTIRTLTAIALLPVVVLAAVVGDGVFLGLVLITTGIGTLEFYHLSRPPKSQGNARIGVPTALVVVMAFYFHEPAIALLAIILCGMLVLIIALFHYTESPRFVVMQMLLTLAGIAYVGFPSAFLVAIREGTSDGLVWLFTVFSVTWTTDTFAYLGGRFFGKRKLAPKLSPKKTVEGAVIGVVSSYVPTLLILAQANLITSALLIVVMISPLVAIAGDLFESALKRYYGVKDSYIDGLNIFPGHGGVLDRVDSLLWVTTVFYLYLVIAGIIGG